MKQELLNIGFQEDSKDKSFLSLTKFPIKQSKSKKNQQDHLGSKDTSSKSKNRNELQRYSKDLYFNSIEDIFKDYQIESFPWNVNKLKISIDSKNNHLSYKEINLQLDFNKIYNNLNSIINLMYPDTKVEFAKSKTQGIWCLVELTNPEYQTDFSNPINPYNNKKNVCGFRFYFTKSKEDISILVTDHFYLGKIPKLLLEQAILLIVKSAGISVQENHLYSIYEYKFNLVSIMNSIFDSYFPTQTDLQEHFVEASRKTKINIVSTSDELIVSSAEKEKLDFKKIPISILESRENFSKNLLLDSNFICGKDIKYDEESIYYLRRLLMNPNYIPESGLDNINIIYQSEPSFLIFKSYLLHQNLKSNHDTALSILSEFSLYFYENIVDFKKLETLNYILHKLLGDMWFDQDIHKSEQCYTKLLNKKYMDSSTDIDTLILLKEVKKQESNKSELKQYLLRMLELQPSEELEGLIQNDLFELLRTNPKTMTESIDHGLSSLSICKDINILYKVIDTMKELKLYTESIDLINSFLNEKKDSLTSSDLSTLKYISSSIWYFNIGRKDMAEEQVQEALEYDTNNIKAIDILISIYKDESNYNEVIKLLGKAIFIVENELKPSSTSNSEPLTQEDYKKLTIKLQELKLDLFNIYLYNSNDKLSATKVFVPISQSKFDYEVLNDFLNTEFLSSNYESCNWEVIHEVLSGLLQETKTKINTLVESSKLDSPEYNLSAIEQETISYFTKAHITLAKLCSHKLHDDYIAALHLVELRNICLLKPNLLKFISMTLINNQDHEKLFNLFENQYHIKPAFVKNGILSSDLLLVSTDESKDSSIQNNSDTNDKKEFLKNIIQEIINILTTSSTKYFSLYIDIILDFYKTYQNQESFIYAVSEKLAQPSSLDKLEFFTEQVISKLENTEVILSVINLNINYLLYLNCPDKNKTLFFLFKRKYSLTPLNHKEMHSILNGFGWEQNKTSQSIRQYIKFFINLLVESKEDIPLPINEILTIIEDDPILLNKYYSSIISSSKPQTQTENSEIYERILNYYIALKDASTVCTIIEKFFNDKIPESVSGSLKTLAFNSNNWILQEKLLYQDKTISTDQVIKMLEVAKTYQQDHPEKASDIYNSILDKYEISDFERYHEIIKFSQNIQNKSLERKALLKCISHPMFEVNVQKYESYILRLKDEYKEKDKIEEILTNLFNSYMSNYKQDPKPELWDQIIYLALLLKKVGLATSQSILVLISQSIQKEKKSFQDSLDLVSDCISLANSIQEIRSTYTELTKICSSTDNAASLSSYLVSKLDNESFDLSTEIFNELKILVCLDIYNGAREKGQRLNKHDKSLSIALDQLLSVLETNSTDIRIIMPLYNLHLLYKNKEELCQYLSIVYPTISSNPDILEDNVTLKEIQQLLDSYNKNLSNSSTAYTPSSINWRQAVEQNMVSSSVTSMISNQAFEKDLEKHIALQTVALISGDLSILDDWHLNVWRHPENYIYSLNYKEHFPEKGIPEFLYTRYYKLISMLIPALSSICKDSLSIKGYVKARKLDYTKLKAKARYIKWDEPELKACGIHKFTICALYANLNLVDLPISTTDIIYDPRKSILYLDLQTFNKLPKTVLLHSLLHVLWSIRLKYYVLLTLPSSEMMPLFDYLKEYFSNSVVKKVKDLFKKEISPIDALLNRLNRADFYRIYSKLQGNITTGHLDLLKTACNTHVERLQIADSLDIIGFMEYKTKSDIIGKRQLQPNEIYSIVPNIQAIMNYILALIP